MLWLITFIAIIAVIILADSLITAVLLISILFNVMLLLGKEQRERMETKPDIKIPLGGATIADSLYGPDYSNYDYYRQSYLNSYKPVTPHAPHAADTGYTIDSAMARLGQARTRDKQIADGVAVRDANYYRYHFADELERSEAKPWWGQYDF
jgi:hypothetical protein